MELQEPGNQETSQFPVVSYYELLQQCTVKLSVSGAGHGTGFFVAPEFILTCAHVVKLEHQSVNVVWQQHHYTATVVQMSKDLQRVDLALLKLGDFIPSHPCVLLDEVIHPGDALYSYGYPDDFAEGAPATFETEGLTADHLIKFKAGQVRPGLSGAPLLNQRTGKVCGVVKFTRDRSVDLGGGAIPTQTVLSEFPELSQQQQTFHQLDQRWTQSIQSIIVDGKSLQSSPAGTLAHSLASVQSPSLKPCRSTFDLRKSYPGLLDRQSEQSNLLTALQNNMSAEVFGRTGSGKTILLEYLANQAQANHYFPDGIIFPHGWGNPVGVNDALQFIFDSLYESNPTVKATEGQIQRYLQDKQALIVLDDTGLDGNALKPLMMAIPHCTILVGTPSRCLIGEQVQAVELGGLPLSDAVVLVERALGRSLTDAEKAVAEVLCTTLNGHPASILQCVAGVSDQRSLTTIVRQLQSDSLMRVILLSLEKQQRWIIAVLAALGGMALFAQHAAALTSLPNAGTVLDSLVERHLVEWDGVRYRLAGNLLELLQSMDLNSWRERALGYFTHWVTHQTLPTLLDNQAVLLHLLTWAIQTGQWQQALVLVRSLSHALMFSGQWDAWHQVLQWGLQAAQAVGDRTTEAWMLHELGTYHLSLRQIEVAQQTLTEAMQLRETLGDGIGAAASRHNLGLLLLPSVPAASETHPTSIGMKPWVIGGAIATITLLGILFGTRFVPNQIIPSPSPTSTTEPSPSPTPSQSPTPPVPRPIPSAPSNLEANALSSTQIQLSWNAKGTVTQQFKIERSTDGGEPFKEIKITSAGTTTYVDANLTKNTTYQYRVRASNAEGNSAYSNVVEITTPTTNVIRLVELILPTEVTADHNGQGTLRLNAAAPDGGVVIQLKSSNPELAVVEPITVPAGETNRTFSLRINAVSVPSPVTITATYANTELSRSLTVQPQPPSPPPEPEPVRLSSLTLTQNPVVGGEALQGRLFLNNPAPAGGMVVQLSSDNPQVVSVPESIQIEATQTEASFDIGTAEVNQAVIVTITAIAAGSEPQQAELTVQPAPPADLEASILFDLIEQTSQFAGNVQIIGAIHNIGEGFFRSRHQEEAFLYEEIPGAEPRIVDRIVLDNIAPGAVVTVSYSRHWNRSSPAEGEFPPTYRLVIMATDNNPHNNAAKRDGQEINQIFQ
jgi:hypothetical protein